MNELVYNFTDDIDREFTEAELAFDVAMKESDYLMEMVSVKTNLNIARAEEKVLLESGTYEDLTVLYEEATGEAVEKKKGVLATIFERIIEFIGRIFEAIGKLFTGENKAAMEEAAKQVGEVQIENPPTKLQAIKNKFTEGTNLIAKVCKHQATQEEVDRFLDGAKKVAIIGAVVGAVTGGAVVAKKQIDKKKAANDAAAQKTTAVRTDTTAGDKMRVNEYSVTKNGKTTKKTVTISAPVLAKAAFDIHEDGKLMTSKLKSAQIVAQNAKLNDQETGWVKSILNTIGGFPKSFGSASKEWFAAIKGKAGEIKDKVTGAKDDAKPVEESVDFMGYDLSNESYFESADLDNDIAEIEALFESFGL